MSVAPAKKSTLATVPEGATGVAVIATTVPAVTVDPAVGAVIETEGAVTNTLTMLDVALTPLESVTLAVRAVIPAVVGVQSKE